MLLAVAEKMRPFETYVGTRIRRFRRRGAAALELALMLVVLVTIAVGVLDLGRFAYTYIAATNACSAAASYGCSAPPTSFPDDAAWMSAVRDFAARETTNLVPPLKAADFQVELRQSPGHDHTCVRVTCTTSFQSILTLWPGLPESLRCEGWSSMPPMP